MDGPGLQSALAPKQLQHPGVDLFAVQLTGVGLLVSMQLQFQLVAVLETAEAVPDAHKLVVGDTEKVPPFDVPQRGHALCSVGSGPMQHELEQLAVRVCLYTPGESCVHAPQGPRVHVEHGVHEVAP